MIDLEPCFTASNGVIQRLFAWRVAFPGCRSTALLEIFLDQIKCMSNGGQRIITQMFDVMMLDL
jgi:hypothetical protein